MNLLISVFTLLLSVNIATSSPIVSSAAGPIFQDAPIAANITVSNVTAEYPELAFDGVIETGIRVLGNSLDPNIKLRQAFGQTSRAGSKDPRSYIDCRLVVYDPRKETDFSASNSRNHPGLWDSPTEIQEKPSPLPLFAWHEVQLTLWRVFQILEDGYSGYPWTNVGLFKKKPSFLWKTEESEVVWALGYKQGGKAYIVYVADSDGEIHTSGKDDGFAEVMTNFTSR